MSAAQAVNCVWETAVPVEAQMEFEAGLAKTVVTAQATLGSGNARGAALEAAPGVTPGVTAGVTSGWSRDFGGWFASSAGIERNLKPPVSLAFYRRRTEQLLRKFMVMSMHVGRCPSVLSNFVFRGKASSVRMTTFEDAVIFTMDMETSLKRLSFQHRELIARIALQEYTQGETAVMMGMCLRSIVMKYGEALDRLTAILMEANLLPLSDDNQCQHPKEYREAVTR